MVRGVFDEIGLYDTIIGGSGTKQLWLEVNMESSLMLLRCKSKNRLVQGVSTCGSRKE